MKYFVLDTNVLLSEGKQALYSFGEDNVVIPMVVLQELDRKKTSPDLGYVARSVLKEIKAVFEGNTGKKETQLDNGYGSLLIEGANYDPLGIFDGPLIPNTSDGDIIKTAKSLQEKYKSDKICIVTKDIQFSILANLNGFETCDLIVEEKSEFDKHIRKVETYYITDEQMSDLYSRGKVVLDPNEVNAPRNVGVILKTYSESSSALAISGNRWDYLLVEKNDKGRVVGHNAEQRMALQVLSDESIGVVSLTGPAGSGKSYMALAKAYEAIESGKQEKIIIYRPVNAVGGAQQELGFLPGDENDKMKPHCQAVYDTIEAFAGTMDAKRIKAEGKITVEPVAYSRGRTISNTIIIVEEAQNLEYATLLTLITRAGGNSRVFLVWDMSQRDNQYIQKTDGVYKIVKKLLGHKLFAHVPLKTSERSAVSSMAVDLLDEL